LKIAFVLTQSLDSPDGIGRCGPIARELVKLGHQAEIIALHPEWNSLEEKSYTSDGVKINYVAQMHVRKDKGVKTYYPEGKLIALAVKASVKLSTTLLKSNADIVHVFKPHPMNSIAGLSSKFFKQKPLYLDIDDYEAVSGHFQSSYQKYVVTSIEKRTPHFAEVVTTNTSFMREKLISWGIPENKILYLPNGVERSRFQNKNNYKINKLKNQLKLNGKKVISFVGSLSFPSHPVNLMVEAYKQIHIKIPDSVLLLVGSGEAEYKLHQQVERLGLSSYVHFCGFIPPADVPNYYYLSDVSVDPVNDDDIARSRLPLKLFESWACGIPFVTGDVGDRSMLLGFPPAGALVNPGDPDSLATEIIRILSDKDLSKTLAHRGLEQIKEFYWDKLTQRLEKIYLKHEPNIL
jgi:glycosyltransferase involved in cell wall biosynthesis